MRFRRASLTYTIVRTYVVFGFLLACSACSNSGLQTARGKVTYKGDAIKDAVVVFVPKDADMKSQHPSAVTQVDGSFSLGTGNKDGAPAGEYIVTITWPEEIKQAKAGKVLSTEGWAPETRDRLNGRYADATTSPLKATIKSGSNSIPTFELN